MKEQRFLVREDRRGRGVTERQTGWQTGLLKLQHFGS